MASLPDGKTWGVCSVQFSANLVKKCYIESRVLTRNLLPNGVYCILSNYGMAKNNYISDGSALIRCVKSHFPLRSNKLEQFCTSQKQLNSY